MKRGYQDYFVISMMLILVLLACPIVSAQLSFNKTAIISTIIKEISTPATFDFTIKNNLNQVDHYSFDTQLNFNIQPTGAIKLNAGEEKSILISAYFSESMRNQFSGTRNYEYYLKSQLLGLEEDTLEIKIVSLKDAISTTLPNGISMADETMEIFVKNKESIVFDGSINVDSALFKENVSISLTPFENKTINIPLKKEDLRKEVGTYPVIISLTFGDYTLNLEDVIELNPYKKILTDDKKINLVLYKRSSIKKSNVGNVPETIIITMNASGFSKAFTSYSTPPTSTREENNKFIMEWEKELKLGEEFEVVATTSYSFSLIILAAIIVFILIYNKVSKKQLTIRKKVVKVKTNTGEFATKVVLYLKNNGNDAEDITITDRLPILAEIHERFGGEKPDTIKKNLLQWKVKELKTGESKLFSYIIYTRVKFTGSLTIPKSEVTYTVNDKEKKTTSNGVFILA